MVLLQGAPGRIMRMSPTLFDAHPPRLRLLMAAVLRTWPGVDSWWSRVWMRELSVPTSALGGTSRAVRIRDGRGRSSARSSMFSTRCLRRLLMTFLGEFTYLCRRASVGPDR